MATKDKCVMASPKVSKPHRDWFVCPWCFLRFKKPKPYCCHLKEHIGGGEGADWLVCLGCGVNKDKLHWSDFERSHKRCLRPGVPIETVSVTQSMVEGHLESAYRILPEVYREYTHSGAPSHETV